MSNIESLTSLPEDIFLIFTDSNNWDSELDHHMQQLQAKDPIAFRDMQLGILYRTFTALQLAFLNTFGDHLSPELNSVMALTHQAIEERMSREHYRNLVTHPLINA